MRPTERILRAVPVALAALLALAAVAAAAEPLALDDSFSGDGWTTFDMGDPSGQGARDMTAAGGGAVFLVGADAAEDAVVLRVTSDGVLAPIFGGGDGIATLDAGGKEFANAVVVDGDGRIVVAGATGIFGHRLMVARLEPDGDPDPTFGGGDGVFSWRRAPAGEDLAVTPSGKVVVVGSFGSPPKALVLRLTETGVFDPNFGGGDGWTTSSFGSSAEFADVALDAKGRIVATGWMNAGLSSDVAVGRLRLDGSFDQRFSGDGRATVDLGERYDRGAAVAIQNDGKIVVAGGTYSDTNDDNDPLLVRFRARGSLDMSFGVNGRRRLDLSAAHERFDDVVVEPDGDLSMAGTAAADTIVATATPNGLSVTYRIKDYTGGIDRGTAIVRRGDGKLWVAGTITSTTQRFGLTRYFPA